MRVRASPRLTIRALAAGACAFGAAASTNKVTPSIAQASVEYRGETIRLSRAYYDYDEYKNDPNNIHPEEVARVKALVIGAPVARVYPDRTSLFRAISELSFPGYGSGSHGETKQADGTKLLLYEVEIPRADANRYLVFRERAGKYALVDDFVEPDGDPIVGVSDAKNGLAYSHARGKVTVREPTAR
jgi:hypothetical protein